jgi:protocatechuate 3,4-dioxygenase beta subunit
MSVPDEVRRSHAVLTNLLGTSFRLAAMADDADRTRDSAGATALRAYDRRTLLKLGGAGIGALLLAACSGDDSGTSAASTSNGSTSIAAGSDTTAPATSAATSSSTASTAAPTTAGSGTTPSCTLSPEVTEGPYYVDGPAVRQDITEGRPGVPVDLRITVVDTTTCQPVANAAVDVWHCDANGVYSGVQGDAGRFLRGIQLSNAEGVATFRTIYPGWYQGRAIHIHLKVHVDGQASGTAYDGGHVAHTGQLFFPEDANVELEQVSPYREDGTGRVVNGDDSIYRQAGGTAAEVELMPVQAGSFDGGFTATIAVGIDPSATPSGLGVGAGGGPGGGPGGGRP